MTRSPPLLLVMECVCERSGEWGGGGENCGLSVLCMKSLESSTLREKSAHGHTVIATSAQRPHDVLQEPLPAGEFGLSASAVAPMKCTVSRTPFPLHAAMHALMGQCIVPETGDPT